MAFDTVVTVAVSFLVSAALTGALLRFLRLRGLLDIPNARSSHAVAVPRGGGAAFVATILVVVSIGWTLGRISPNVAGALLIGGAGVAVIGFVDDHHPVDAAVRLAVHFLAFAWCAWALGRLPPIDFGVLSVDLGFAGTAVAVIFLVWFLNLYNFMDGIDGIASVEAICITGVAAGLLALRGGDTSAIWFLLALSSAVTGFLVWNWPPARLFMGDVGSGFLGFVIGAIAWATVATNQLSVWVWSILAGAFVVDATVTLLRRWKRGERLDEAHRNHAYQRLSRRYRSHLRVTLGFLAVNLLWLGPMAAAATLWPRWGSALTLVAWAPLVLIAWRSGAGLPDQSDDRGPGNRVA